MQFLRFTSLLAFASFALSAPILRDLHNTQLNVEAYDGAEGTLDTGISVTLERRDYLVDDTQADGLLGERLSRVAVDFSVFGGDVTCNGEVVPLGVSHMDIAVTQFTLAPEGLESQFDRGIAKVQLDVVTDEMMQDGVAFRRATIHLTWLEINNESIEAQDVVQQVIDIFPATAECYDPLLVDSDTKEPSENPQLALIVQRPDASKPLPKPVQVQSDAPQSVAESSFDAIQKTASAQKQQVVDVVAEWYAHQSAVVRGIVTGLFGLLATTLAFMLGTSLAAAFIMLRQRAAGYQAVQLEQKEGEKKQQVETQDVKAALL